MAGWAKVFGSSPTSPSSQTSKFHDFSNFYFMQPTSKFHADASWQRPIEPLVIRPMHAGKLF